MSMAQEIAGEIDAEHVTENRARVPADVLNLRWVYAHFPLAWEFSSGKWIPELTQISFRKGLNGQAEDSSFNQHKQHIVNKGGVVIEQTNPRLGPYKNYRRSFPAFNSQTKQVGTYFASMFETPTVIGTRHAKWTIDTKGYADFRQYLVTKGIIESIDASVVEAKIDEKRGLLDHLKSLSSNQLRAERILQLEALITAMEESLLAMESEAAPVTLSGEVDTDASDASDNILDVADGPTPTPAPRRKPGKRS